MVQRRIGQTVPTEHAEQKCLIQYACLQAKKEPLWSLLFAVPNGGFRHKKTAVLMLEEGVKPGVPDLILPVARGGFHGLYIEMKRIKGSKVEATQKWWHEQLAAQGYLVVVCKGWIAAKETIESYLKGGEQ